MSHHKSPNAQWEDQIVYDNAEFTLATGSTDFDVSAEAVSSDAFDGITTVKYVSIRTNYTITIKLNSTSNDSITITSSDSPYVLKHDDTGIIVSNIYITNASGSTAAIKIFLA